MAISVPLRHELKFFISPLEYQVLSRALDRVLWRDRNGDENNEYHIRSLYFDTRFNDALLDKINGVKDRDKFRIRIYNFSDKLIRMECKTKVGQLISKRSIAIPKLLAEQLIAADPTGLERTRSGLLRDVYREMAINGLHPVVIVDYVREAYVHPAEDVRITFDKDLRTGVFSRDLFDPGLPTVSAMGGYDMILEVKFNEHLPAYYHGLLQVESAQRSAVSKYILCRKFE